MKLSPHRVAAVGGLALLIALGPPGTPGAMAGTAPAGSRPADPATVRPAEVGGTTRITLITGDVVEVSVAGPGRYAATVTPATGRERIGFHTVEVDGGLRVLPVDVIPYVSAGVLDADLFDVQELIDDGFGDLAEDALPLIVRYQDPAAGLRRQTVGAETVRPLASVGGAALDADKDELAEFWKSVAAAPGARSTGKPTFGGGIAQIWLDGRVRPVLDRSVAQIGAPAAWQAGLDGTGVTVAVLDTGVDAKHPDLASRVREARNFSNSSDTVDRHGHGTHVAATVAGTGAASGGSRRGVAPGANLLIGKVLGDDGSGSESEIIAGMEWATASGARVVNMSLGGGPTDGTDPMSQAVDQLTADTGALFVIAAGNSGEDSSVGSPGAATTALTVGAVDRDEKLASFSSRGPRWGDEALKPEITAPGVGIVAARAAGTSMGQPTDAHHTGASGTSMAAPHVAGAAALIAQANPDWRAADLKNALVSTARQNPELNVYAQGTGRVDVARAVGQPVHGTGVADFGLRTYSGGNQPVITKTVTYRNTGSAAVSLNLAVAVDNLDSKKVESDAFTTGATSVTVPAGGTVDVPLRLDPAKLDKGRHSGWLTASGPGDTLIRTAIGLTYEGQRHRVKVRALGMDGKPGEAEVVALFGENSRSDVLDSVYADQVHTYLLEEGTYFLHALTSQFTPLDQQYTVVTDPMLKVTGDLEVVIDPRRATPVRVETPKPAEQQTVISFYNHRVHPNGRSISHGTMYFHTLDQVNVTPTRKVSDGSYEFSYRGQLTAPLVQGDVPGVNGELELNLLNESPTYQGKRRFPLVHAGTGTPAELARARARDAVAVVEAGENADDLELVAAAAAAKAAGLLIIRPASEEAGTFWGPDGERLPVLAMAMPHDDGQRLLARVRKGGARMDLTLTPASPYLYDVMFVERGRVPDRIRHRVTPANSVRIASRYTDTGGFGWTNEQRFGWRPWQGYAWNDRQRFVPTPHEREDWVSANDTLWQHMVNHRYYRYDGALNEGFTQTPRSYRPGRAHETWLGPVIRPAAPQGEPQVLSTRTNDTLALRIPEFVDAEGHFNVSDPTEVSARLFRDGKLLEELPNARGNVAVPAGDAAYRLELSTARSDEEWIWGTRTETAWTFRSARPSGTTAQTLALLQLDYDAPVDLRGRASGRGHQVGLKLRQQAGLPAPTRTSVTAEVSFDEGRTWKRARTSGHGTSYRIEVPAGRGETVSLRVQATDGAGSAVTQTVIRAYGLG